MLRAVLIAVAVMFLATGMPTSAEARPRPAASKKVVKKAKKKPVKKSAKRKSTKKKRRKTEKTEPRRPLP